MASHASLRAKLKWVNRQLSGVLGGGGGGGAPATSDEVPIVERGGRRAQLLRARLLRARLLRARLLHC